jgi:hypothetical protein
MRYAAVLTDQAEVIERIVSCFASDTARICKLGEAWALQSSTFDSCKEAAEVAPVADALVRRINRILALYAGLLSPLTVAYIQSFNADGKPIDRSIRNSVTINIYSVEGIFALMNPRGHQPLGSAIIQNAATDEAIEEALNLRGDQELGWSQIYDIIEFLGGAQEIENKGWAEKKRAQNIRRTANHFRHLGSLKKYPLPAKPPTIQEARAFAGDLLRQWIASRL